MIKAKMAELLRTISKGTIAASKLTTLLEIDRSGRHLNHTMEKGQENTYSLLSKHIVFIFQSQYYSTKF